MWWSKVTRVSALSRGGRIFDDVVTGSWHGRTVAVKRFEVCFATSYATLRYLSTATSLRSAPLPSYAMPRYCPTPCAVLTHVVRCCVVPGAAGRACLEQAPDVRAGVPPFMDAIPFMEAIPPSMAAMILFTGALSTFMGTLGPFMEVVPPFMAATLTFSGADPDSAGRDATPQPHLPPRVLGALGSRCGDVLGFATVMC